MEFGKFIRECRVERGFALNYIARLIGISPAYLSRVERDIEKPPRDEVIDRLCHALGISTDDAFAAARRLPPDLRGKIAEVISTYRSVCSEQR